MATTGYTDTFNRTVAGGLGTADSGQTYTINGTASQYSVAPGTASIAVAQNINVLGIVDIQSGQFVDITGQVALGAIPATNLATVGFIAKASSVGNWYTASMMVATGGAISVRFSKDVAGALVTLSTTGTGLTYVANTFYNLRFQAYWSRTLQVNVLSAKLWAVGTAEPGGWTATSTTDAAFTDYTGGTSAGIIARDESTTLGTITAKFQNVVSRSYDLPVPAAADPMCADPAVSFPKQTALQSLAAAADTVMAALDPLTSLAALFPRVRVSNSNQTFSSSGSPTMTFASTEFNIGTPTNLGYNTQALYLPVGIWLITFEIQLGEAASSSFLAQIFGGPNFGNTETDLRSNPVQLNDQGVGGCGHLSSLTYVTDPTTPNQYGVNLFAAGTNVYTIKYVALSAMKISDYFL
jgi:hypothetical protein